MRFWRNLPGPCYLEDDWALRPVETDSIEKGTPKSVEDEPLEEVNPTNVVRALALPDELWLAITAHLEAIDQLSLRQTCRRLFHFSAPANIATVCASEGTRRYWLLRLGRDAYHRALQIEADTDPAHQHRLACAACQTTHARTAFPPPALRHPGSHRHCHPATRLLPLHGGKTSLTLPDLSTLLHPTPTTPLRLGKHSHPLSTFSTTEITLSPPTLLIHETYHLRAPGIRLYPYHRPALAHQSLVALALRLCAHLTALEPPRWDSELRCPRACPAPGCGMRFWFETEDLDYGPEWERGTRVVLRVERRLRWPVVWAGEGAWVGATRGSGVG